MKQTIYLLLLLLSSSIVAHGQCYPDRHNTTWYDQWISCEASLSPNAERGLSHWIMYDFGKKIEMKAIHVWNSNIPGYLDYGMKSVAIDYSDDGENWHELGTYQFDQASGKNIYQGFDVESFASFKTRYLLLTGLSNYGGACYGLSEVRFDLDSTAYGIDENNQDGCLAATIYPNPFQKQTTLRIAVGCNKKTSWMVTDSYGRVVVPRHDIPTPTSQNLIIDASSWSAGIYYLTLRQEENIRQYKLVKLGGK